MQLPADFQHYPARDAVQAAVRNWRCEHGTVLHNENVVARAFGHITQVVQHQGFRRTLAHSFHFGQDVVEIIERLDLRTNGVRTVAAHGAGNQGQPVFIYVRIVQGDFIRNDEDAGPFAVEWVKSQIADAAGNHQTDIAVVQAGGRDRFAYGVGEFFLSVRNIQQQIMGAVVQAVHVVFQAENALVIEPDTFKNAVSIECAVVENRGFCFLLFHQLSI